MTDFPINLDNANYSKIRDNFLAELRKASLNQPSSLSFIKTLLPETPLVPSGLIQAVVIGGSNFEFADVHINKNKTYEILKRKKGALPTLRTASDLADVFGEHYNPDAEAVVINFAFPLEATTGSKHELDGIFLHGTKEHVIEGLVGQRVGEFIRKRVYKKDIPITVANDTACLTLSGTGSEQAAMVLGTGFNMSLDMLEDEGRTVVNLEAGGFNGVIMNESLEEIDRVSEQPGKYLMEKSVAGRYLVEHYNNQAKKLNLKSQSVKSTKELSILAENPATDEGKLAKQILEKSARLIASVAAGLYEFLDKPAKLEIIVEGSLFWKGYKYHELVNEQLNKFGFKNQEVVFKKIEDSSLNGAINLLIK